MNKSGITELKKTLKPDRTAIDFMVTAFVKHEEGGAISITSYKKQRLLALEDTAMFKYLEVAKSTLSGKFDKNLLNIEFPVEAEMPGGAQDKLMKLRDSKLNNDELVKAYIEEMAENYDTAEHLMITLYHGVYDVPTKTKDKMALDESEAVYDFVLCSICPMKLEKPGIYFNGETGEFETITQKLVVDKPVAGFLFPAFNDRATDLHEMLFFVKKADETHPEFINAVSGQKAPLPADVQKNIFENIISETVKKVTFDEERALHEKVNGMIEARKAEERDMIVSKDDILNIIMSCVDGVDKTTLSKTYDTAIEGYDTSEFSLMNIIKAESFDVEMADIKIKVKPDKTNVIERKVVDGQDVFMIPVYEGGVEVNGKPIA